MRVLLGRAVEAHAVPVLLSMPCAVWFAFLSTGVTARVHIDWLQASYKNRSEELTSGKESTCA